MFSGFYATTFSISSPIFFDLFFFLFSSIEYDKQIYSFD